MDPCVTSCGLTLKVRAVPELAVPSAVETGLSESMMRGVSGQGRGGQVWSTLVSAFHCLSGPSIRAESMSGGVLRPVVVGP